MPIRQRQPETLHPMTSHRVPGPRPGGAGGGTWDVGVLHSPRSPAVPAPVRGRGGACLHRVCMLLDRPAESRARSRRLVDSSLRGSIRGTRMTDTASGLETQLALDLDARRLGHLLREPSSWPSRWTEPDFGFEVERFRRHVAPFRSLRSLATAYGRDVRRLTRHHIDRDVPSPIRVAYALRALEIQEDATGPSWPALIR